MLNSIEVRNVIGTLTATLPITNPTADDRYRIKDIAGLDPVKATINTSPYALQDGGFYQSSKGGERNIVIKMGAVPRYNAETNLSIEDLRREAYSIFPPKALVKLNFLNSDIDYPEVEITGYVEYTQSDIFSKDPMIDISIICPKPNFKEPSKHILADQPSMTDIEFPYRGDADTGFELHLDIASTLESLIVYNSGVSTPLRLDFPVLPPINRLVSGDKVIISTIPGAKKIHVVRGGVTINALENMVSGSMSMILGPAVKSFRIDAIPVAGQTSNFLYDIHCWPAYVGL